MLAAKRRSTIINILKEKGETSTKYLQEILNVSGATIRNDLTELENQEMIKRIHGGATLNEKFNIPNSYIDLHSRSKKNINEKKAISKLAVDLVKKDQTVFCDASSTVLYFIAQLKEYLNLTIVTNGIFTALTIKQFLSSNVILLGGSLRKDSGAIEGLLSDDILEKLHGDIMFTSAHGFSLREGLTDFNLYEVELKKKMVKKSQKLVALVDHSKIGNISTTSFAGIEEIDILVTDDKTSSEIIEKIREKGIEVLVANIE